MWQCAVGGHRWLHAVFIVPVKESEAFARVGTIASDVVVARPIDGGRIHVVDHVVDQIGNVEIVWIRRIGRPIGVIALDTLIGRVGGEVSIAGGEVTGVVLYQRE